MLNIAHAGVTEQVNGPGRRFTVWVQGCPQRCPGCFNPALQAGTPRQRVEPLGLARRAVDAGPVAGVSLSGGEPFAQAAGLVRFVDAWRELAAADGGSVLVFSGYTLPQLRAGPAAWQDLLARTDLLVDGPYRQGERGDGLPLRGSRNQRLVALTPRGEALRAAVADLPGAEVQVDISPQGEVVVSGFPPPDLLRQLRQS